VLTIRKKEPRFPTFFVAFLPIFLSSSLPALDLTSVDSGFDESWSLYGQESAVFLPWCSVTTAAITVSADDLLARQLAVAGAKRIRYFHTRNSWSIRDVVAIRFGARELVLERTKKGGESGAKRLLPACFRTGSLPSQPATTQGGGQVLIELKVDRFGRVSDAKVLRSTQPFTALLREAVQDWRFEPARKIANDEGREAIESRVLVAGWFPPPTLYSGAMPGEPPKEVAEPSVDLAYPRSTVTPGYPPDGRGNQVVLTEVEVGKDGSVVEATILRSAGGFDSVALDAARQWDFRPAQWEGEAARTFSYIVFGFREPVTVVKP
jgi:TonB family protein